MDCESAINYVQVPGNVSGMQHTLLNECGNMSFQIEKGGHHIENALKHINIQYQTLFFSAGLFLTFSSLISCMSSFGISRFPNFLLSTFLLWNGLTLMLLDVPGTPRWAGKYRRHVRKNFRILTRITGKSAWLAVQGSIALVNIRTLNGNGFISALLSTIISIFTFTVSFMGFLIAMKKSFRLERVKSSIRQVSKGSYIDCYRKYAIGDPEHGMQFEEFNRMCADHTCGRFQFDIVDLYIIYNVLDEHQKCAINEREFYEWMAGPIVML